MRKLRFFVTGVLVYIAGYALWSGVSTWLIGRIDSNQFSLYWTLLGTLWIIISIAAGFCVSSLSRRREAVLGGLVGVSGSLLVIVFLYGIVGFEMPTVVAISWIFLSGVVALIGALIYPLDTGSPSK